MAQPRVHGAGARAWAVAAGLLGAAPTLAQEPADSALPTVVEGLMVDAESGRPFPNIQLRFDTGQRITSDERGQFGLEGISPGHHVVALVTGRCNVTFAELELAPGEIKRVAFQIPSERTGWLPDHAELEKRSEGEYYSSAELQAMSVRNLLDALRRVAPDMVGPEGGQPGADASLIGRTRSSQGAVPPVVVVDGILVSDGVRALRDFKPTDVESLELLKGASRGWAYGTGASGGVIKVVTRQGELGYGVEHPDRCDIGAWPGRENQPTQRDVRAPV